MIGTPDGLVESVRRAVRDPIASVDEWQSYVRKTASPDGKTIRSVILNDEECRASIVATLKGVRETMGGSEVSVFSGVLCKDDIDALIAKYEVGTR